MAEFYKAASSSNFDFNVAYNNPIDFLSTVIDNDGADDFFRLNAEQQLGFTVGVEIKQEVMSPGGGDSGDSSRSEYSTPCSQPHASYRDTPAPTHLAYDDDDDCDTPVAEQLDDLDQLQDCMKTLCLSAAKPTPGRKSVKFDGLELTMPREKEHPMETRLDVVANTPLKQMELRSRCVKRPSPPAEPGAAEPEPEELQEPEPDEPEPEEPEPDELEPEEPEPDEPEPEEPEPDEPEPEEPVPDEPEPEEVLVAVPEILPEPVVFKSNIRTVPFDRPMKIKVPQKAASGPLKARHTLVPAMKPPSAAAMAAGKRKWHDSPSDVPQQPVKFTSMAENIHKFHFATPDRFRSLPKPGGAKPKSRQTMHATKSTIPVSPALQARLRARPNHAPSHAQEEEDEAQQMQAIRQATKALPLNPRVFKTPQLGKRVEKKVTAIQPFKLTVIEPKPKVAEARFTFTARPVPRAMLAGPTGLKDKVELKVTEPITPAFVRRQNSAKKTVVQGIDDRNKEDVAVAKEVYHFGIFSARKTKVEAHRRQTQVVPFSFEQRQKEADQRKEEQRQKVLDAERKARQFHANPLPRSLGSSRSSLQENAAPSTSHLANDVYAERRQERIRRKLELEEAELKKSVVFKARPASVLYAKPFQPKHADHVLTEIAPFNLNTERRAKQWDHNSQEAKAREEERAEERKQQETEKERAEREERMKLRREAVHKARPIPKTHPLVIKPSDKALTTPHSPFSRNKM